MLSRRTTKYPNRRHALTVVVGVTCPCDKVGREWEAAAAAALAAASTARCISSKVFNWPGAHGWNTGSRAYAILAVAIYLNMPVKHPQSEKK